MAFFVSSLRHFSPTGKVKMYLAGLGERLLGPLIISAATDKCRFIKKRKVKLNLPCKLPDKL